MKNIPFLFLKESLTPCQKNLLLLKKQSEKKKRHVSHQSMSIPSRVAKELNEALGKEIFTIHEMLERLDDIGGRFYGDEWQVERTQPRDLPPLEFKETDNLSKRIHLTIERSLEQLRYLICDMDEDIEDIYERVYNGATQRRQNI